jgi:hypothetical protein
LRIAAAGELGFKLKIYLDRGQGYSSRDMLVLDVPSATAPSAMTKDGPDRDAKPGNP